MGTQVEIVLRNPRAPAEIYRVFLEPTAIPLAARWIAALAQALRSPNILEKDWCFLGFPRASRDRAFLCRRLNSALEEIRSYRGTGPWENGYEIGETCDAFDLSQERLNRLHHHFEILSGQVWSPRPYLENATPALRLAIRRLNNLVHELEHLERSVADLEKYQRVWPIMITSFTNNGGSRQPLRDEDYEDFSFPMEFGDVVMHYCQTGKTHFDAWRDGDQDIFDANINGLRYYSGEFTVYWGPSSNRAHQEKNTLAPFYEWLRERGAQLERRSHFVDARGVKQGLGQLIVGRVAAGQFGKKSVADIQAAVAAHSDIYQIRVHQNGGVTEKTFDYFAIDEIYESLLLGQL